MQLFDIIVAMIFLCSLVAVSRFRQHLTAEDRQSYNHIAFGLSILAMISLVQIYKGLGVFASVPFISDPLFFKLAYCIGVMTGLTFLINGVTTWVPLSRSYRMFNREKIRKLELIKKTEQLARVENRLPVVFKKTLEQMLSAHDLTKGAVFAYSSSSSKFILVSECHAEEQDSPDLHDIVFSPSAAAAFARHCGVTADIVIDSLPHGIDMPQLVLPVLAGDRLAGLFLLWGENSSRLSDEERMNLKIAADIIGRKMHLDVLQMGSSFEKELRQWQANLESNLDRTRDAKEILAGLAQQLGNKVAFDLFSLTMVFGKNVAQRYTLGGTGGVLSEPNVDFERADSVTREVFVRGNPLYLADKADERWGRVDDIVTMGEYQSMWLHPVKIGNSVEAVMTLASKEPRYFTSSRRQYIEALVPTLSGFVTLDRHRREIGVRERRAFAVNNFVSEIRGEQDLQTVFSHAASILSKELKPTVVRVSTVDADGAFLNSRALESNGKIGSVTPAGGSMILSLMPYHQLVLDTGRPMMINQEQTDRKMTQPESTQVFGIDLKSALIVPVKVNSSNVAVISLADSRNWSDYQFTQADIQFVTSIAVVLEMAIHIARTRKPARSTLKIVRSKSVDPGIPEPEARNRIRSSLTGILGSVELLKTNPTPTEESIERCLSIIDKSARRINEYIGAVDSQ
ncbi:MAG: GAF domain-containing protein [Candidatus Zixiibacteriota bacterium]